MFGGLITLIAMSGCRENLSELREGVRRTNPDQLFGGVLGEIWHDPDIIKPVLDGSPTDRVYGELQPTPIRWGRSIHAQESRCSSCFNP